MAIIRITAVLKALSGLARDNCVNTWHFEGTPDEPTFIALCNRVREFYEDPTLVSGTNRTIVSYLSGNIGALDCFAYIIPGTLTESGRETPSGVPAYSDLGPVSGTPWTSARLDTAELPNEVAVCLSYQGTPEPGLNQPRRRGRVYLGPLNVAASEQTAVGPRPVGTLRSHMAEAAKRLAVDADVDAEWVVYSRPYAGRGVIERPGRADLPAIPARAASTVNIDQVWVDDEFDTQRRRGLQRTGRTLILTGEV